MCCTVYVYISVCFGLHPRKENHLLNVVVVVNTRSEDRPPLWQFIYKCSLVYTCKKIQTNQYLPQCHCLLMSSLFIADSNSSKSVYTMISMIAHPTYPNEKHCERKSFHRLLEFVWLTSAWSTGTGFVVRTVKQVPKATKPHQYRMLHHFNIYVVLTPLLLFVLIRIVSSTLTTIATTYNIIFAAYMNNTTLIIKYSNTCRAHVTAKATWKHCGP